jgi:hypothetical protein
MHQNVQAELIYPSVEVFPCVLDYINLYLLRDFTLGNLIYFGL